ncbi:MAG: fumarylacetoacetase [Bacteroidia bacterium]|nr:fumarylacetoacetase [Bacteroidia bacterium]
MKSWFPVPEDTDFTIWNFPFGIYTDNHVRHRACSAIGDYIIDLFELESADVFDLNRNVFEKQFLNDFISLGKKKTNLVRNKLIELFTSENSILKKDEALLKRVLKKQSEVKMLLPVQIGDYTDFYSSIYHATNVGSMFRDPNNALLPNWKHLPVGYHGRSSSIFVSGHSFYRPKGQTKSPDKTMPEFGPCKLLDFELETAFIIGKETKQGDSIRPDEAHEYIFGMVLFNDWSARDIQTWEYQPLGPFLAKNFASTISPWIVTMEALEPFRTKGFDFNPPLLPYLQYKGDKHLDIELQVFLKTPDDTETLLCTSNQKYLYYTMEQQLAHHTVNGCPVRVGDLMASGTISGPEKHQFGSMLELTWKGTQPIQLNNGEQRKFINDHDTIIFRGKAKKGEITLGFGECISTVLPAKT